ncbi:tetratricopeptide repeat protein [uncultured Duncaniella sp.]|uniref:tetratricopeptide repeat protein n=2 Tax=uncultured Duncaniella sp. TaxID=2768039 RepID=UPI0025E94D25|nr:tetratricopeptide repeat protein [uncultured Duncaniella sp.]
MFTFLCPMLALRAQINTEQVMRIGANTNYFEDYVLSIQYFNQVISVNPRLAKPYFYRAIAKLNLDDFPGAEEDASLAIERNPFIVDAYEVRGVARQNQGKNREAIKDYNKVLEMHPDTRSVLFNKAMAQCQIKDHAGADTTFAALIRKYPRYEGGYLGRARLRLETKDTIGAKSDIDKALTINSSAINAYLMRADIAIHSGQDYKSALADMDMAVKLSPDFPGYYINRAFLRYMTDDFYGAFDDYDHALKLDPTNSMALFNRGLLRAEVHDTNKAIEDFTSVINLNPDDYKTLYNRSMLLAEIGDFEAALSDLNRVLEAYPDFAAAYFLRYDIKRRKGDLQSAEKDYNKSLALAKTKVPVSPDKQFADNTSAGNSQDEDGDGPVVTETQEQVKKRFSSLATVSANYTSENDATTIRGRVQDQELKVELEPIFIITYYTSPTEIKLNSEYIREVNDLNATGLLRFGLQVANRESTLRDDNVETTHRSSIDFYNSYIASHPPRAIDYFGRAMDFYTVGDFDAAVGDLTTAVRLTPDFALAYLLRAQVRYAKKHKATDDGQGTHILSEEESVDILADIEKAISLSPFMPVAYYNKGVVLTEIGHLDEALKAFTRAIELKRDFGEAYYNRGYVHLTIGDKDKAFPDLSRAGELGIVSSYSLLKRMASGR